MPKFFVFSFSPKTGYSFKQSFDAETVEPVRRTCQQAIQQKDQLFGEDTFAIFELKELVIAKKPC